MSRTLRNGMGSKPDEPILTYWPGNGKLERFPFRWSNQLFRCFSTWLYDVSFSVPNGLEAFQSPFSGFHVWKAMIDSRCPQIKKGAVWRRTLDWSIRRPPFGEKNSILNLFLRPQGARRSARRKEVSLVRARPRRKMNWIRLASPGEDYS